MITVFTPTYNRAKTLERLYESLKQQTDKRFEWLLVDDGSSDNTQEIVDSFIRENIIDINYIWQENQGLNAAINLGVQLAKGEIFFRIDSDDYASTDAIEKIFKYWNLIDSEHICGLVFSRKMSNEEQEGFYPLRDITQTDFFSYRNTYKGRGDMAEVIKTSVMKEFPFPKFREEKFCPEGLIWNRMAEKYNAIYIPEYIYICEYIEGGLTNSVRSNLRKNALGTTTYYSEIFRFKTRPPFYIKSAISFWRYASCNGNTLLRNIRMLPLTATLIGITPGLLLYLFDSFHIKHN
ncbi:MAG: glycosyltransferase family A protein [Paludibacteraceae bacterium]